MNDMEYTTLEIRRAAQEIVKLTDEPEFGTFVWYLMIGQWMHRLKTLETVLPVPEHLKDVPYHREIKR